MQTRPNNRKKSKRDKRRALYKSLLGEYHDDSDSSADSSEDERKLKKLKENSSDTLIEGEKVKVSPDNVSSGFDVKTDKMRISKELSNSIEGNSRFEDKENNKRQVSERSDDGTDDSIHTKVDKPKKVAPHSEIKFRITQFSKDIMLDPVKKVPADECVANDTIEFSKKETTENADSKRPLFCDLEYVDSSLNIVKMESDSNYPLIKIKAEKVRESTENNSKDKRILSGKVVDGKKETKDDINNGISKVVPEQKASEIDVIDVDAIEQMSKKSSVHDVPPSCYLPRIPDQMKATAVPNQKSNAPSNTTTFAHNSLLKQLYHAADGNRFYSSNSSSIPNGTTYTKFLKAQETTNNHREKLHDHIPSLRPTMTTNTSNKNIYYKTDNHYDNIQYASTVNNASMSRNQSQYNGVIANYNDKSKQQNQSTSGFVSNSSSAQRLNQSAETVAKINNLIRQSNTNNRRSKQTQKIANPFLQPIFNVITNYSPFLQAELAEYFLDYYSTYTASKSPMQVAAYVKNGFIRNRTKLYRDNKDSATAIIRPHNQPDANTNTNNRNSSYTTTTSPIPPNGISQTSGTSTIQPINNSNLYPIVSNTMQTNQIAQQSRTTLNSVMNQSNQCPVQVQHYPNIPTSKNGTYANQNNYLRPTTPNDSFNTNPAPAPYSTTYPRTGDSFQSTNVANNNNTHFPFQTAPNNNSFRQNSNNNNVSHNQQISTNHNNNIRPIQNNHITLNLNLQPNQNPQQSYQVLNQIKNFLNNPTLG